MKVEVEAISSREGKAVSKSGSAVAGLVIRVGVYCRFNGRREQKGGGERRDIDVAEGGGEDSQIWSLVFPDSLVDIVSCLVHLGEIPHAHLGYREREDLTST